MMFLNFLSNIEQVFSNKIVTTKNNSNARLCDAEKPRLTALILFIILTSSIWKAERLLNFAHTFNLDL